MRIVSTNGKSIGRGTVLLACRRGVFLLTRLCIRGSPLPSTLNENSYRDFKSDKAHRPGASSRIF